MEKVGGIGIQCLETREAAKLSISTMHRAAPDDKELFTSAQKYHCRVWDRKKYCFPFLVDYILQSVRFDVCPSGGVCVCVVCVFD